MSEPQDPKLGIVVNPDGIYSFTNRDNNGTQEEPRSPSRGLADRFSFSEHKHDPKLGIVENPDGTYSFTNRDNNGTQEEPRSPSRGLADRFSFSEHKHDVNGKKVFDGSSFERLEVIESHDGRCMHIQKGFLKSGEAVVLNVIDASSKQHMKEIDSFAALPEHKNILHLLGTWRDGDTVALVTEHQDDDLLNYIKGPKCNKQEWHDISIQMSNGLNHLHAHNIIHRDISLRSFLVKFNHPGVTVKLCHSELSRVLELGEVYNFNKNVPIPWAHSAYEVLKFGWFSPDSDVYSFGITMWEVFSGGRGPFRDGTLGRDYVMYCYEHSGSVVKLLGLDNILPQIKLLIACCTKTFAHQRPKMVDIASYLASSEDGHLRIDNIPEYFEREILQIFYDKNMPHQSLSLSDLKLTEGDVTPILEKYPRKPGQIRLKPPTAGIARPRESEEVNINVPRRLPTDSMSVLQAKIGGKVFDESSFKNLQVIETRKGQRGDMHKGFLKSGEAVFVKAVDVTSEQNWEELKSFAAVPVHENVLNLIGTWRDGDTISLVTSLPDDDLLSWVKNPKCSKDGWNELALQMIRGLDHLRKHNIIHRGITLCAFLVIFKSRGVSVKVCDFEVRKVLELDEVYNCNKQISATWVHAPYEVLKFDSFTQESDIYSFGITLWELFSGGQMPFGGGTLIREDVIHVAVSDGSVLQCLGVDGLTPRIILLIDGCTRTLRHERPNMSDVSSYLASSDDQIHTDNIPEYFENRILEMYKDTRNQNSSLHFSDIGLTDEDIAKLEHNSECTAEYTAAMGKYQDPGNDTAGIGDGSSLMTANGNEEKQCAPERTSPLPITERVEEDHSPASDGKQDDESEHGHPDDSYSILVNTPNKLAEVTEVVRGKQRNVSIGGKTRIFDELNAARTKGIKAEKTVLIYQMDLLDITYLDRGHFGTTFKAMWKTKAVVVKASREGATVDDFQELKILQSLPPSPNVLSLIGVCRDFIYEGIHKHTFALVVPYQANGNLKRFVQHLVHKQGQLLQFESINIVLGMAKGLAHLHENNMVHRDLALRNYLANIVGRILIADFGLSRGLDGTGDNMYYRSSGAEVPWRTNPLEVFEGQPYTKACDIWAFGIAVWELFHTSLFPFPEKHNPLQLWNLLKSDNFDFSLDYGDKNEVDYPALLEQVVDSCCQIEPSKRLTVVELIDLVTGRDERMKNHKTSKEWRFAKRQRNELQMKLSSCISEKKFTEAQQVNCDLEHHLKIMKEIFMQEIEDDSYLIQGAKQIKYELQEKLRECVEKKLFVTAQRFSDILSGDNKRSTPGEIQIDREDVDTDISIFLQTLLNPKHRTMQQTDVDTYVCMCNGIGLYDVSELSEYLADTSAEDLADDAFVLKKGHVRKIGKALFNGVDYRAFKTKMLQAINHSAAMEKAADILIPVAQSQNVVVARSALRSQGIIGRVSDLSEG